MMVEVQDRNEALPAPRRTKARWAALSILLHLLAEGGAIFYALQLSRPVEDEGMKNAVMPLHYMTVAPPMPIRSLTFLSNQDFYFPERGTVNNYHQVGDTLFTDGRDLWIFSMSQRKWKRSWSIKRTEGLFKGFGVDKWRTSIVMDQAYNLLKRPPKSKMLPNGYAAWIMEGLQGLVILDSSGKATAGVRGQHVLGVSEMNGEKSKEVKLKMIPLPEQPVSVEVYGEYILAYGEEAEVYVISCKGKPEKWQNIATIRAPGKVEAVAVSGSGVVLVATEGSRSLSVWQLPGLNRKPPIKLSEAPINLLTKGDTLYLLGKAGLYAIQISSGKRLASQKLINNPYRKLKWINDKSALFIESYSIENIQLNGKKQKLMTFENLEIRELHKLKRIWNDDLWNNELNNNYPRIGYCHFLFHGLPDTLIIQYVALKERAPQRLLINR